MKTYCYDIEVKQDFFCAIFVDTTTDVKYIREILELFPDKTLHELVKEYKLVKGYEFVIYDTRNDLDKFMFFIRQEIYLVSFNGRSYDDNLLYLLDINYDIYKSYTTRMILNEIKLVSDRLINYGDIWWNDDILKNLHYHSMEFIPIDEMLMVYETTEKRSLKYTLIQLKFPRITSMPFDVNSITLSDEVPIILDYCLTDVIGLLFLYYHTKELLKIRFEIIKQYKVHDRKTQLKLLSANKSTIGDIIGGLLYYERTGIYLDRDKYTKRNGIYLDSVIFSSIWFSDPILQKFLEELKKRVIFDTRGELSDITITYNSVTYQFGTGGLHSKDNAKKFICTENELLEDVDFNAFYPKIISEYKIEPEHLIPGVFPKLIGDVILDKDRAKEEGNASKEYTMKIILNSWSFGKLMFDGSPIKDNLAGLKVTVNGQLIQLMMIENFVAKGITPISVNTDGVTCLVPIDKLKEYKIICKYFAEYTKIGNKIVEYNLYIRKDINNYIAITKEGKVKTKGIFNGEIDLSKGYRMPIIGIALREYFIKGTPIEETIRNHYTIYDFLITERMTKSVDLVMIGIKNGKEYRDKLQHETRWYSSLQGGYLFKVGDSVTAIMKRQKVTVFNTYIKKNMSEYGIDYNYYITEAKSIVETIEQGYSFSHHNTDKYKKTVVRKPKSYTMSRTKRASNPAAEIIKKNKPKPAKKIDKGLGNYKLF